MTRFAPLVPVIGHVPAWVRLFPLGQFEWAEWEGDAGAAVVVYDDAGALRWREFRFVRRIEQGPRENLLWRAKRQWHRWFP